jgi:transglutaminase-like putative cysteine protease
MDDYLRATPMAQSGEARLRDLARQVVGSQTDAYRAALALNNWVFRNLGKMESEPRPITALQVLDQGKGDCSEHALLMATLARAVGLPSRLVAGLAVIGDKLFYHAWVEVYVGEWVEMDPTWGEAGVDAGHLLLARSALDEVSYARMSLDTGRTLGTLGAKVVDYQAEE